MWEKPETWISVGFFAFGLLLSTFMYFLEKRPRRDFRPKLFPTTLFLLIGLLLMMGSGAHILLLSGYHLPSNQP